MFATTKKTSVLLHYRKIHLMEINKPLNQGKQRDQYFPCNNYLRILNSKIKYQSFFIEFS